MNSNKIKIKHIIMYIIPWVIFIIINLVSHQSYCKKVISTQDFLRKNNLNSPLTVLIKNRSDFVIQTQENQNDLTIKFKGNGINKFRDVAELGDILKKDKESSLVTLIKKNGFEYTFEFDTKKHLTCYLKK